MFDEIFFYLFALLTLGGAIMTIAHRNAVMSAVWLTVSLLGVAGIFLLGGAEFLFVSQIILYIGGITLLFLFVIMLVNLDTAAKVRQFRRGWPAITLAAVALAFELITVLHRSSSLTTKPPHPLAADANSESLADLLLSRYAISFELISVLLLVAIVGSVWMGQARREREM